MGNIEDWYTKDLFPEKNKNAKILTMEIKKELTDSCPMPTGKYKGDKMENVPAWYLLWLYDQNMCPQSVKNYIDENRQVLELQNKQKQ